MTVLPFTELNPYTAFAIDGACPPTFALCFSPDAVIVLPYSYLYCAVWVKGKKGHDIVLDHRVGRFYIEGENLAPLLAGFEKFIVGTVQVFIPERHAPVKHPGATVVTFIDDSYSNNS
jgi:hypothetical protein